MKSARQPGPAAEGLLNILVAADNIRAELEAACEAFSVTHAQYNVLRILRGVYPGGHPRCEIAQRLIERAPDVTRLIDRLEVRGLVERSRAKEDRRLSLTRITTEGLELLQKIDPQLQAIESAYAQRLSSSEWRALSTFCERLYHDEQEARHA
ncbi:MAG TPA: MarR family transcriptional regulator [Bryobacteraceae bacterium]|nr:MarR family transcriptional regulator [Bryobacteraceae bacterium]